MVPRFRVSLYLIAVIAVIGSVSAKPSLHSTCDELPGITALNSATVVVFPMIPSSEANYLFAGIREDY